MELLPPISASLGAMVSLAGKLDALQLDTELKDEVMKLKSRLLMLSKAPDPPSTVSTWMSDVRELSYDMDNCVDTGEEACIDQVPGFKARAKEANGRFDRYIPEIVPSPTCVLRISDHRLLMVDGGRKHADPAVTGLHGTGGPVDRLIQRLSHEEKKLIVVPILGAGGIGKTTLVKQIWRHNKLGDFHCRAFVRTAKKPDMRRMLRSILAQVRPHKPPDANDVHDLIHDISEHLKDKRYLLIIDDLWATSVWDVASRAFPEGNHGSRIITTTEIEDVALACSSYQSTCIFEMVPLCDSQSKELFTSAVFRSGEQYSSLFEEVTDEIIKRCAGLPQAIIIMSSVLASQGEANTVHNREQILSNLPTNTTSSEILKQVLKFCYNCLPSCLQTCLLYLSFFPESYVILKEDIVKQWVAEGFILAATENEKMKVAGSYFDKLVNMGLIQHIYVGYSDEILYYAVHHRVHDLITSNSIKENFVTVMDYRQRTVRFSNNVSRLSLQFGSARHATSPESTTTGLSQVRSLAYFGLGSCWPASVYEFKLLRSLILHIWADQQRTGVDLRRISQLLLLRYLQVTCNDTVHLPHQLHGLQHLETVEINATVAVLPSDILHVLSLLHLRLGVGTELPDVTSILKNVTLIPPISLDELSSPHNSVKTIELFSPICRIPKWIGQFRKLSILKIVVRELLSDDMNNMQGLPSLTVLSLYVQQRTREQIGFATESFAALEYFEFRCGVLQLTFQEGAMPNLQRLKLGFNASRGEQYGCSVVGFEHLSNVQEIVAIIGVSAGAEESEWEATKTAFQISIIGKHPSNVSVIRTAMSDEEYGCPEKQHSIIEKNPAGEQPGSEKQESRKDVKQSADSNSQSINRAAGWDPSREGAPPPSSFPIVPSAQRFSPVLKKNHLEKMSSTEASSIPFQTIKTITDDFSEAKKIGSGGYGEVYRGFLNGDEVAVKKLFPVNDIVDDDFNNEFSNLMKVQHKNIVRLLHYCYEKVHKHTEQNGQFFFSEVTDRALCFEYMKLGSLSKHISDESCDYDWPTTYKIIKGTCEGLHHLHKGLGEKNYIYHLDLKPDNILLDENLVPKIGDFGLSRLFGDSKTHETSKTKGTIGFMPPEYINNAKVTPKNDVFSLGVIIFYILAGKKGYGDYSDALHRQNYSPNIRQGFIESVKDCWKKKMEAIVGYRWDKTDIMGITKCAEIAISCVHAERDSRPSTMAIVGDLNKLDAQIEEILKNDPKPLIGVVQYEKLTLLESSPIVVEAIKGKMSVADSGKMSRREIINDIAKLNDEIKKMRTMVQQTTTRSNMSGPVAAAHAAGRGNLDVVIVYAFDCTNSTPAWEKVGLVFSLVEKKLANFVDSCIGYVYVMSTPNTYKSDMNFVDPSKKGESSATRAVCTKNMAAGLPEAHKLMRGNGDQNGIILLFSDGLVNTGDFFDGAEDFVSTVPVHTFTLGGDAFNYGLEAISAKSPGGTFIPLPVPEKPVLSVPFTRQIDSILSGTAKDDQLDPNSNSGRWPLDVVIVYAFDCTTSTPAWHTVNDVYELVEGKLSQFVDSCLGFTYLMSTPNTYTSDMTLVGSNEKSSAWSRDTCTKNMASGLTEAHKLIGYRGHSNSIILLFSDGLINKGDFFEGAEDFISKVPVHTFTLGGDEYNNGLRAMARNSPGGVFFSPLPVPNKPSQSVPFSRMLDSILNNATKDGEKHHTPNSGRWPLDVVIVYAFDCTESTPDWYKVGGVYSLVEEKLKHLGETCLGFIYVMSTPNTYVSDMNLLEPSKTGYTESPARSRTTCIKNMASGLPEAHRLMSDHGHLNGMILLFSDGQINKGDFFDGAEDFISKVPVHTFTLGGDAYNHGLHTIASNSPGGSFSTIPLTDMPSLSVPFLRQLDSLLDGTTRDDSKHPSAYSGSWPLDVVIVYAFDCTDSTLAWYTVGDVYSMVQGKLLTNSESSIGFTYVMLTPNTCTSDMNLASSTMSGYERSAARSRTTCVKNMACGLVEAHKLISYRGHQNSLILLFSDGLINKGDFFDGAEDYISKVPVHTFTLGGDAYNHGLRSMAANSPGGKFHNIQVPDKPILSETFSQLLDSIIGDNLQTSYSLRPGLKDIIFKSCNPKILRHKSI